MYKQYLKILFLSILIFTIYQCDKEQERIPYVYVNIQKSIDDPELNAVLIPGNYVYLTGGVNGIILYRFSNDEFIAWERTCPYVPSDNCRISLDETDVFCACPCCESEYSIIDGTAVKGPSTYPLKSYKTYFDGYYIRIYN
jgi:nitrite reductase/ring-hydroxylating ferredoxin subunit